MSTDERTRSDLSLREIVTILGKSVREHKKDSLRAPLYVTGEVIKGIVHSMITSPVT